MRYFCQHAGSQVGGPTSVAPAQDEDTGERLIRSAAEKEEEDKTKKKSEKRKAMVKKGKSVGKKTQKKGKRLRLGKQRVRKKNRSKKLIGRRKTKQSIVFTGENCDFIDFASVRTLGAGCVDGTKMVLKNK